MCGIVGVVGANNAVNKIISGLKKLEYRGYDSAGVAVIENSSFQMVKQEGKILNLEKAAKKSKFLDKFFNTAIGHTRWATHGRPSERNAHPHASSKVCVVHNGIIENYQELKSILQKKDVNFVSDTDSEVVPHLLEMNMHNSNLDQAIVKTLSQIKGSYALAIMISSHPDFIIIAKKGSPLLVGFGKDENFIASDYYALASFTNKISYLEDEEFAYVYNDHVDFFNLNAQKISKEIRLMESSENNVSKDGFENYMLKEIYEQPMVLENTLQNYVDLQNNKIHLPNFLFDLSKIKKITAIACGTSYYSAMIAKYIIEDIAQISVEVEIASEFRYRKAVFDDSNLMIFISQSGETADTIAAMKYAKQNKQKILSIVNVAQSSMAHLSDAIIKTMAGPEIGVASTKAYTAQISVLAILAIEFATKNKKIDGEEAGFYLKQISNSIHSIKQIISKESINNIKKVAKKLIKYKDILYIGRGVSYVTALESSLKMRELSYINAQGIAAGELKHGTIALIDKKMPIIAIAYNNNLFEKIASNIEEVKARQGRVYLVADSHAKKEISGLAEDVINVPDVSGFIEESLTGVVALQLLAYYVALYKGNDVDQPRNLAKSVTVE